MRALRVAHASGGRGVTDPEERERYFGQVDHVRLCGRDYGERLEAAGFGVELVDYVERLDDAERARYGLRLGSRPTSARGPRTPDGL